MTLFLYVIRSLATPIPRSVRDRAPALRSLGSRLGRCTAGPLRLRRLLLLARFSGGAALRSWLTHLLRGSELGLTAPLPLDLGQLERAQPLHGGLHHVDGVRGAQ